MGRNAQRLSFFAHDPRRPYPEVEKIEQADWSRLESILGRDIPAAELIAGELATPFARFARALHDLLPDFADGSSDRSITDEASRSRQS